MGIGWLWYFTHSADADRLQAINERRAAAAYAWWGALSRRVADLMGRSRDGWEALRRERDARRELHALSEHMLRDIGLSREGIDGQIEAVHRSTRTSPRWRPVPVRRPTPRVARAKAPNVSTVPSGSIATNLSNTSDAPNASEAANASLRTTTASAAPDAPRDETVDPPSSRAA